MEIKKDDIVVLYTGELQAKVLEVHDSYIIVDWIEDGEDEPSGRVQTVPKKDFKLVE